MLKLEEVYLKIIKGINWIDLSDNKENSQDLEATFKRNFPPIFPNCRLVDLNTTGMPKHIQITLRKTKNVSFHMKIVEKNMALARRRQYSFAYNGQFLGIDNLKETSDVEIELSVKQSHYSDQDIKINCVNYPTKRFESFRECDEVYTNKEMQKIGIMPFWAVKGNNNVTTSK